MFFRNKAKATITVTPASQPELKLLVENLPLKFYQKTPQKAAKISIENAEDGSVEIEALNSTNFWIEEGSDGTGFWLMVGRTENQSLEVRIRAKEILFGKREIQRVLKIPMDSESRKLDLIGAKEFMQIKVNESLPLGFVVHHFHVNGVYPEEAKLIR